MMNHLQGNMDPQRECLELNTAFVFYRNLGLEVLSPIDWKEGSANNKNIFWLVEEYLGSIPQGSFY